MLEIEPDYFTLADAASLLGKKTDTLKKWFGNGCPHRKNGRTYEVRIRDVFEWRLEYERELLMGGGGEGEPVMLNLEQERAKLARAQTEAAQMLNAQRRGELVIAREVEEAWAGMIASAKVKLLSLGNKIAARLGVANPRIVADQINKEVRAALRELSSNADRGTDSESVEEV